MESGKAAITLRPNDPRTWLTVAKIYQNLINVADNAETFALESYTKAIALDRANPSLRLEYANLLAQIADSKKTTIESAILKNRAASHDTPGWVHTLRYISYASLYDRFSYSPLCRSSHFVHTHTGILTLTVMQRHPSNIIDFGLLMLH